MSWTLDAARTPPEKETAIIEAWHTPEPVKSIAVRFGVTPTTVSNIAKRAGLDPRYLGAHNMTREELCAALAEVYSTQTEVSPDDIARQFKISVGTMYNLLKEGGVPLRRPLSPELKTAIVEARRAGKRPGEISKAVGVSRGTVLNVATRAGLGPYQRETGARDQAIAKARVGGERVCSIANRFHMSVTNVNTILRRLKVANPHTVGRIRPRFPGKRSHRKEIYCGETVFLPMANKRRRVLNYRLVVARQIGRCLSPEENVHHINHDATDNRPENLMLFSSSAEHTHYERYGYPMPLWTGCPACAIPGNDPYTGTWNHPLNRQHIWGRVAKLSRPERLAREERLERMWEEREEQLLEAQELRRRWGTDEGF